MSRECELIGLLSAVLYLVAAVHKLDLRLVTRRTLTNVTQCTVIQLYVADSTYIVSPQRLAQR